MQQESLPTSNSSKHKASTIPQPSSSSSSSAAHHQPSTSSANASSSATAGPSSGSYKKSKVLRHLKRSNDKKLQEQQRRANAAAGHKEAQRHANVTTDNRGRGESGSVSTTSPIIPLSPHHHHHSRAHLYRTNNNEASSSSPPSIASPTFGPIMESVNPSGYLTPAVGSGSKVVSLTSSDNEESYEMVSETEAPDQSEVAMSAETVPAASGSTQSNIVPRSSNVISPSRNAVTRPQSDSNRRTYGSLGGLNISKSSGGNSDDAYRGRRRSDEQRSHSGRYGPSAHASSSSKSVRRSSNGDRASAEAELRESLRSLLSSPANSTVSSATTSLQKKSRRRRSSSVMSHYSDSNGSRIRYKYTSSIPEPSYSSTSTATNASASAKSSRRRKSLGLKTPPLYSPTPPDMGDSGSVDVRVMSDSSHHHHQDIGSGHQRVNIPDFDHFTFTDIPLYSTLPVSQASPMLEKKLETIPSASTMGHDGSSNNNNSSKPSSPTTVPKSRFPNPTGISSLFDEQPDDEGSDGEGRNKASCRLDYLDSYVFTSFSPNDGEGGNVQLLSQLSGKSSVKGGSGVVTSSAGGKDQNYNSTQITEKTSLFMLTDVSSPHSARSYDSGRGDQHIEVGGAPTLSIISVKDAEEQIQRSIFYREMDSTFRLIDGKNGRIDNEKAAGGNSGGHGGREWAKPGTDIRRITLLIFGTGFCLGMGAGLWYLHSKSSSSSSSILFGGGSSAAAGSRGTASSTATGMSVIDMLPPSLIPAGLGGGVMAGVHSSSRVIYGQS
ncbi:hypothetical protein H4219_005253 [Mycoemilia scoparia]|uniref:Uncharacterized protein n=1 Tax=Mycoemilia scoparia TaxID=417184 RepID=A0A9W8DPX0_9FUNG|nr:hypothetical protein H4219_005253 [Mycoemilia scoparia]